MFCFCGRRARSSSVSLRHLLAFERGVWVSDARSRASLHCYSERLQTPRSGGNRHSRVRAQGGKKAFQCERDTPEPPCPEELCAVGTQVWKIKHGGVLGFPGLRALVMWCFDAFCVTIALGQMLTLSQPFADIRRQHGRPVPKRVPNYFFVSTRWLAYMLTPFVIGVRQTTVAVLDDHGTAEVEPFHGGPFQLERVFSSLLLAAAAVFFCVCVSCFLARSRHSRGNTARTLSSSTTWRIRAASCWRFATT